MVIISLIAIHGCFYHMFIHHESQDSYRLEAVYIIVASAVAEDEHDGHHQASDDTVEDDFDNGKHYLLVTEEIFEPMSIPLLTLSQ